MRKLAFLHLFIRHREGTRIFWDGLRPKKIQEGGLELFSLFSLFSRGVLNLCEGRRSKEDQNFFMHAKGRGRRQEQQTIGRQKRCPLSTNMIPPLSLAYTHLAIVLQQNVATASSVMVVAELSYINLLSL